MESSSHSRSSAVGIDQKEGGRKGGSCSDGSKEGEEMSGVGVGEERDEQGERTRAKERK
jgi:hypothetical protein